MAEGNLSPKERKQAKCVDGEMLFSFKNQSTLILNLMTLELIEMFFFIIELQANSKEKFWLPM
jgi:hypothetical protein